MCVVGKQTGLFRAQCKQAAESLLGARTWTRGGYRRTGNLVEISAEQGRSEGGQWKHGTAYLEGILEEDNSRKTAIIRKVLKKGRHN